MPAAVYHFQKQGMSETRTESDNHLVLLCQQGETQAFGLLVQRHMQRAYFIALALTGSPDEARDLSQEAFVRAYRAIAKYDPATGTFFTWYYRILRNLCFNFLRDRRRHARPFSEIGETALAQLSAPAEQNPQVLAERRELQEALWRALDSLKPAAREMIVLRDFQGMSYKEIAEALHCPPGTVMSRLFEARRRLRELMEDYL